MSNLTESQEYLKLMEKLQKKKKAKDNGVEWRACLMLVEDTQLLHYLNSYHPHVMEEFYIWKKEEDRKNKELEE